MCIFVGLNFEREEPKGISTVVNNLNRNTLTLDRRHHRRGHGALRFDGHRPSERHRSVGDRALMDHRHRGQRVQHGIHGGIQRQHEDRHPSEHLRRNKNETNPIDYAVVIPLNIGEL